MNEFNVAVCDDEDYYIADIKKYVVAFESESETKLNIYEYNSGLELLQDMQNSGVKFHLVFLDVDMPEYSGIDTAIELRKTDKNVVICFETSYEQYAYEAYQVEALGYIVKPVKYVELKKLLERAIINIRYCIDDIYMPGQNPSYNARAIYCCNRSISAAPHPTRHCITHR